VRELSSPRVDQSARCPVRELAIRELAYPRVVQLPYHFPDLYSGPCSSVGMRRGTDRQTERDTDTQAAVTTIHFTSASLTRNVIKSFDLLQGHNINVPGTNGAAAAILLQHVPKLLLFQLKSQFISNSSSIRSSRALIGLMVNIYSFSATYDILDPRKVVALRGRPSLNLTLFLPGLYQDYI